MIIKYNPIYSEIESCPPEFVKGLASKLAHNIEEDTLKLYINQLGKSIPITSKYMFRASLNPDKTFNVKMYSGYIGEVIKTIYKGDTCINPKELTIDSSIEKLKITEKNISPVLFEHQQRIVDACYTNKRGIIKSPTGSGKSFAIAEMVRKFSSMSLNILITVPTINLLTQLSENINEFRALNNLDDIELGKVGDGNFDFKNVTVGIPNSLSKLDRTKEYLETVDVLIADEVHMCANPTYALMFSGLTNLKASLGLSATPPDVLDYNAQILHCFFGPRILEIEEYEMIEKKIIMEPYFRFYSAPRAFLPPKLQEFSGNISNLANAHRYKVLAQVYDYLIINNKGRNNMIIEKAIERIELDVGPVIIIVNKVKGDSSHAEPLAASFESKGYNLPIISGYISKKKRASILTDLKNFKIKGAIAGPKVLSAGVSIPSLSTIILAGAGKSDADFIQRVGRILRQFEGKERPVVIDFIDPDYWFRNQSEARYNTAVEIYGYQNVTRIK